MGPRSSRKGPGRMQGSCRIFNLRKKQFSSPTTAGVCECNCSRCRHAHGRGMEGPTPMPQYDTDAPTIYGHSREMAYAAPFYHGESKGSPALIRGGARGRAMPPPLIGAVPQPPPVMALRPPPLMRMQPPPMSRPYAFAQVQPSPYAYPPEDSHGPPPPEMLERSQPIARRRTQRHAPAPEPEP